MTADAYKRIWNTVADIPRGRVATYGQIARLAGLGRRARMVGFALHSAPGELGLPWHRVINAQGRISLPAHSEGFSRQRRLLEDEGIEFVNGRIDLAVYRWLPGSEEWPEEYLEAD